MGLPSLHNAEQLLALVSTESGGREDVVHNQFSYKHLTHTRRMSRSPGRLILASAH